MFTRIDHVMICVPDVARGIDQYRKLGFDMREGGVHPGKGTHNAIAFNDEDYVELLGIRDEAEAKAARSWSSSGTPLWEFIAAGGGIRYIVIQSDDLAADVAAMRGRGVEVSDATEGARKTPAGVALSWKLAVLGPANPLPIFFIQHVTPLEERRRAVPVAGGHPNGVYTLERAYVVTNDAEGSGGALCEGARHRAAAAAEGHGDHVEHGRVPDRSHRARHRAAVCAGPGVGLARAARPRPFPGALSNDEHGRRREVDGGTRLAAPRARRAQHRRARDARAARRRVRRLHRLRRPRMKIRVRVTFPKRDAKSDSDPDYSAKTRRYDDRPPSAAIVVPLTIRDSSDARNTPIAAMCSGSPMENG
jgi:hypothetical protein